MIYLTDTKVNTKKSSVHIKAMCDYDVQNDTELNALMYKIDPRQMLTVASGKVKSLFVINVPKIVAKPLKIYFYVSSVTNTRGIKTVGQQLARDVKHNLYTTDSIDRCITCLTNTIVGECICKSVATDIKLYSDATTRQLTTQDGKLFIDDCVMPAVTKADTYTGVVYNFEDVKFYNKPVTMIDLAEDYTIDYIADEVPRTHVRSAILTLKKTVTQSENTQSNHEGAYLHKMYPQACCSLCDATKRYSIVSNNVNLPPVPFKVYVFACHKMSYYNPKQEYFLCMHSETHKLYAKTLYENTDLRDYYDADYSVIGEFTCTDVQPVVVTYAKQNTRRVLMGLEEQDITDSVTETVDSLAYSLMYTGSRGKAMHITDLHMYTRPLSISSFREINTQCVCRLSYVRGKPSNWVYRYATNYKVLKNMTKKMVLDDDAIASARQIITQNKVVAQAQAWETIYQHMLGKKVSVNTDMQVTETVAQTDVETDAESVTNTMLITATRKDDNIGEHELSENTITSNAAFTHVLNDAQPIYTLAKAITCALDTCKCTLPSVNTIVSIAEALYADGVIVSTSYNIV